ncbi:hypothetical protein C1752_03375 [Acaryochloris thomasi RCC1774]|uniref:Uncharacterized protein n=1 Tax=Acaryochloris thomasi RCC1774 TaxID=1764569 RepID=A0A2W1JWY5_9CYAN|nr:hypothetical protein C1752_03375 [Acaryochloris thomasi RCC1774]
MSSAIFNRQISCSITLAEILPVSDCSTLLNECQVHVQGTFEDFRNSTTIAVSRLRLQTYASSHWDNLLQALSGLLTMRGLLKFGGINAGQPDCLGFSTRIPNSNCIAITHRNNCA